MASREGIRISAVNVRDTLRISVVTVWDAFRDDVQRDRSDDRLHWWAHRLIEQAEIDLRVEGKENIPVGETFVVMSNHQGYYDIPIVFEVVPGTLRMVAKTELFRVPIWGRAMRESGFFELDRQNRERAIATLNVAKERLRSGVHVWIAPEGTRSKTGALGSFKKGGFMLAVDSETRILPIGISGTRFVMPPGTFATTPKQVVGVAIGKPIDVLGKDRDALMTETRGVLEALVKRADELRG